MSAQETAIRDRLVASVPALVADVNLFIGPEQPPDRSPRESVWIIDTGGPVNLRYCGTAQDYRVHSVQVLVRSDHYDRETGQTLAQACFDAIHGAELAGYMSCLVREASPVYLGEDERECHAWTINAMLERTT